MRKWLARGGWMALGIAGLYGASALAGVVSGGPLDPPYAPTAGTMKTIDSIAPSWFQLLPSDDGDVCTNSRFYCVMNDEAVLDRETGLVWERDGTTPVVSWVDAMNVCYTSLIGGRWGWRLPTAPEIMTLASSTVNVPAPSPFTGMYPGGPGQSGYWTATDDPGTSTSAYIVAWGLGIVSVSKNQALVQGRVLCVRASDDP